MSKKLRLILSTCILGMIICFIAFNANNKEKDEDVKTENEIIEAEDIGVEEVEAETIEDEEEKLNEESSESEKPKEEKETEAKKEEPKEKVDEVKEPEPKEEPKEEVNESSNLVSLGKFKLTAYCPCSKCCGKSDGITASGTKATQGRTVACNSLEIGTKIRINGHDYVVEDRGTSHIDIFFNSHQSALNFGVQYAEVFVVK